MPIDRPELISDSYSSDRDQPPLLLLRNLWQAMISCLLLLDKARRLRLSSLTSGHVDYPESLPQLEPFAGLYLTLPPLESGFAPELETDVAERALIGASWP
jgi:hypothetical protein